MEIEGTLSLGPLEAKFFACFLHFSSYVRSSTEGGLDAVLKRRVAGRGCWIVTPR